MVLDGGTFDVRTDVTHDARKQGDAQASASGGQLGVKVPCPEVWRATIGEFLQPVLPRDMGDISSNAMKCQSRGGGRTLEPRFCSNLAGCACLETHAQVLPDGSEDRR